MLYDSKKYLKDLYHEEPFYTSKELINLIGNFPINYQRHFVKKLSTDIYVLRNLRLLNAGLDHGYFCREDECYYVMFNPKSTNGYQPHEVEITRVNFNHLTLRSSNPIDIRGQYVRVDLNIGLDFEWLLPRESLIGINNLPDGLYQYNRKEGWRTDNDVESYDLCHTTMHTTGMVPTPP